MREAVAPARQLPRIGLDKAHPIGHVEGEVETVDVVLKLILRILGNQYRQSTAWVQIVRLPVDPHRPSQGFAHFSGSVWIKSGVSVQHDAQIHHVPAAAGVRSKGIHPAASPADIRGVALFHFVHQHSAEAFHGALQPLHFPQVDRAHRQVVLWRCFQPGLHVAVDDPPAQRLRRHSGVLTDCVQPGRIVPAEAGLQLLAGDKIVDVIVGQHGGHLIGGHHAGVTSEQVDVKAVQSFVQIIQHIVDFNERQPVLLLGRVVKANAGFGARAVIPQYDRRPVCRILGKAILQELQKAFPAAHGSPAPVRNGFEFTVADGDEVAGVARDFVKRPFRRATGEHHDIDFIAGFGDAHFIDVVAAGLLQIGAAHIDQQRQVCLRDSADAHLYKSCHKEQKQYLFHRISPNSAALLNASARVVTPSFW